MHRTTNLVIKPQSHVRTLRDGIIHDNYHARDDRFPSEQQTKLIVTIVNVVVDDLKVK